jgi:hypothetical protein
MIGINTFVKRQTADSKFSHFNGTWEALIALVVACFSNQKPGYRDGVILVTVPADGFFAGVCKATDKLTYKTTFEARRQGEASFLQTVAIGAEKLPAKVVEIVLYSHGTLGADATTEEPWEAISINARTTEGPEPLTPVAMARNQKELPGGTKASYSPEEWAESVLYWSEHVMIGQ